MSSAVMVFVVASTDTEAEMVCPLLVLTSTVTVAVLKSNVCLNDA